MQPSDDSFGFEEEKAGQNLAVLAEALYLINLLLLPGLAFLILAGLWFKFRDSAPLLARQHLRQTTFVSLIGGLLIVVLSGLILGLGGLHWEWTWVTLILYFTCIHSTLVLFGMYALIKAMNGQMWRFPIIGPAIPQPKSASFAAQSSGKNAQN
ncbi:MAG: hypothetical protein KBF41_07145 [Azonexus sp.]|jgi:uncharacterized Tic20 family protein|nr:hypothetical protein [Azonexus sp.]